MKTCWEPRYPASTLRTYRGFRPVPLTWTPWYYDGTHDEVPRCLGGKYAYFYTVPEHEYCQKTTVLFKYYCVSTMVIFDGNSLITTVMFNRYRIITAVINNGYLMNTAVILLQMPYENRGNYITGTV